MEEYTIEFLPGREKIKVTGSDSILDAAIAVGIRIISPCGGRRRCGKCKVIIKEGAVRIDESLQITPEMLKASYESKEEIRKYHLACRTYPVSDLKVLIPPESLLLEHQIMEDIRDIEEQILKGTEADIALDIGTSTIAAYLVDSSNNEVAGYSVSYNRQCAYGEDILSRIDYAKRGGGNELRKSALDTINHLIDKLVRGRGQVNVNRVCVAGNTTMINILLGRDPSIDNEKSDLAVNKESYISDARSMGVNANDKLIALPHISGYVGGDIVADVLASGLHKSENMSMIIDVGTNGEIVLGNRDMLITCATSAGPAFEGCEISCGMKAECGAVDHVTINRDMEIEFATINNDKARGICGSGLIDLVAELFLKGLIDHKGKYTKLAFETGHMRDTIKKEYTIVASDETSTGEDITLTERDIEKIIQSKAAIYAGAVTLARVGVDFNEIERIYIAGGFGYYLHIDNAIAIGLLPDLPEDRFTFMGNGSLKGAHLALADESKLEDAEEIANKATYLNLSGDKTFNEEYMRSLYLPYQDSSRFPSIQEKTDNLDV